MLCFVLLKVPWKTGSVMKEDLQQYTALRTAMHCFGAVEVCYFYYCHCGLFLGDVRLKCHLVLLLRFLLRDLARP